MTERTSAEIRREMDSRPLLNTPEDKALVDALYVALGREAQAEQAATMTEVGSTFAVPKPVPVEDVPEPPAPRFPLGEVYQGHERTIASAERAVVDAGLPATALAPVLTLMESLAPHERMPSQTTAEAQDQAAQRCYDALMIRYGGHNPEVVRLIMERAQEGADKFRLRGLVKSLGFYSHPDVVAEVGRLYSRFLGEDVWPPVVDRLRPVE